jgi:hypothetical protein
LQPHGAIDLSQQLAYAAMIRNRSQKGLRY